MVAADHAQGQHPTASESFRATVHFGGDKADLEVAGDTKISTVKTEALKALQVPQDGNIQYFLKFQGRRVADESATIESLAGPGGQRHLTFHLEKVFGGGGHGGHGG